MNHLFILAQLLLVSSLIETGSAFALLLSAAAYHLADAFLYCKLKIRLHPSLFPLLLRPASFWSSLKKLNPLPFSLFLLSLFAGFGLALFPLLPLLQKIHPFFFLILFFATGIGSFFEKPLFPNPLFIVQLDALAAIRKWGRKKKEVSAPAFPQEDCHFLSPRYPLLRLTSRYRGDKCAEIDLQKGEKPHLLFVILESFRAENTGCLGAKTALSPHFDALAEKGVLFTRFHATGNLTNRCAVASLFGVPPAYHAWHMGRYVDIPLIGLPQILTPFGYHPALIQGGSLAFDHGVEFFQGHGFKTLLGKRDIEKQRPCSGTSWGAFDEFLMPFAADWLAEQKEPTFLTLFSITGHHPWTVPSHWKPPHAAQNNPYLSAFAYTDWTLQLLIDALEKKELLEKSILFIFGDHGQELADRDPHFEINCHLYQENIHVPLLIYAKHRIAHPSRIDTLSSQTDLLPTVLDLLQIPGPHHSLGASLLRDPAKPIFFSYPFDPPIRGCREGNWKLLLQNNKEELFDLSSDPEEKTDRAQEHPDIVEKLKKTLSGHAALVDALYENRNFAPSPKTNKENKTFHLDFSHSLRITDETLIETVRTCPHLTSLSLSHCALITDKGISALFELCPSLEKLNLEGLDEITGAGWPPAPHLMHLKALDCPKLDGKNSWLKNLPALRILQLGSASLSDEDLISLSQTAAPLLTLQFSGLENITDRGLQPLIASQRHLEMLSLEDCPLISDASLQALNSRLLDHLFLANCPGITDAGLQPLDSFPLKCLFLKNCPNLTPAGLVRLKTKPGLQIFALNCPHLPVEDYNGA